MSDKNSLDYIVGELAYGFKMADKEWREPAVVTEFVSLARPRREGRPESAGAAERTSARACICARGGSGKSTTRCASSLGVWVANRWTA